MTTFQGGSIKFWCAVCARVHVERDGESCAGCKNRFRDQPEPLWRRLIGKIFGE
jgi:hypothetical protein